MLTKTSEYALRSLIYIAMQAGGERKTGIKEIAHELELPMHFIGKILQDLVRKGLIASTKGPHGGFYLNHPAESITIMDVVREIDGLEIFKRCGLGLKQCSDSHPCPLHNDFSIFRDGIAKVFTRKTIQNLVLDIQEGRAFIINEKDVAPEEVASLNFLKFR
jgi:Rrf2 family protein